VLHCRSTLRMVKCRVALVLLLAVASAGTGTASAQFEIATYIGSVAVDGPVANVDGVTVVAPSTAFISSGAEGSLAAKLLYYDAVIVNQFKAAGVPMWLALVLTTVLLGLVTVPLFKIPAEALSRLFAYCEKTGRLHRLQPGIPVVADVQHPWQSTVDIFVNSALFFGIVIYFRHGLLVKATWELTASAWLHVVLFKMVHDVWFWSWHSLLHSNKRLFMAIHYLHHEDPATLSPHSSTYFSLPEAIVSIPSFILIGVAFIYNFAPTFNLAAAAFEILSFAVSDMNAHSGYHLPRWFEGLTTLGIGALPFSGSSKSHYIHHLDPRYNRSGYFTFMDKLFGTYREDHPAIVPPPRKKMD